MLIITIPKSASSSLQDTLNKLHFKKNVFIKRVDSEEAPNKEVLTFLINDKEHFYKEHIIPTESNLSFLKDKKKVLLLRDPEECKESFERGIRENIHKRSNKTLSNFDYTNFYDKWIKVNDENTLKIFFGDLIKDPKKEINKIENFYGLRISKRVKLSKILYSRSRCRRYIRSIYKFLRTYNCLRYIRRKYLNKLQLIIVE